MGYIVVPNSQAPAVNEALGRLFAASLDPPEGWPIPARFDTGEINPDLRAARYYYTEPRPGLNGTHTAFDVDDLVRTWLGQTVATSFGEIMLPGEVAELGDDWLLTGEEDPEEEKTLQEEDPVDEEPEEYGELEDERGR